jgi:MiaB-like tRNA modifying enzyme
VRVYVETYGCAQNQGEGASIARELFARGLGVVGTPASADVAVLVTCGVIGATEARMVRRWESLAAVTPRLVVTGCLVPLGADRFRGEARSRTTFVPIREQSRLAEILSAEAPSPSLEHPSGAPPIPSMAEEIVIAQGCTSGCSYCFSRLARGSLESVPVEAVVERAQEALGRGVREVRLTGLDTAAWGRDLSGRPTLPELVRAVARLEGPFRVRVGMLSPQSLEPILEEHVGALGEPRVFRFLHLPVQSGSDRILSAMHRGHTVEQFRRQVEAARRRLPDLHLATDLIVGYPGETEDDHRASEALLGAVGPETVNVTRFSPRPGTPAARLAPLPPRVAKERSRSLTGLRQRIARERLERWIGREEPALVLEYGPRGTAVARLENYLPVVLGQRPALGATVDVRIDGARSTYLVGRARAPEV